MADGGEQDVDEREIIEFLFYRGYEYEEILQLLIRNYDIHMSLSTLKRRLKRYNLCRRNPNYDICAIRDAIIELQDGPGSIVGYRSIWHSLQMKGIQVPRIVVQELVQELDPEGVESRRAHRLKRREYMCAGPNSVWHMDGYDKLKPFGFPIHGCIDGFSRKILWLYVTSSNNLPDNIAAYYLDAVREFGGCPLEVNTDLGTENGIVGGIHCFFRDDTEAHRYVASPRNQRIEGWWSFLKRNWSTWWINFFKDMTEKGVLNTADPLEKECLWFCFSELLQKELNDVKLLWNTHYIRKSRHDTVYGRPDYLYSLPELHGGDANLLVPVRDSELSYAYAHLVEENGQTDYQQYFGYVKDTLNIEKPSHWREANLLYEKLLHIALSGTP